MMTQSLSYNDCGIEVGHSEVDFKLNIDPIFFEPAEEYIDTDGDAETDELNDEGGSDISTDDDASIQEDIPALGKDSAFEQGSQDVNSAF